MGFTQATQSSKSPNPAAWPKSEGDDSVRITARQVLREHYEAEYTKQAVVAAWDANDLKVLRSQGRPTSAAEMRASNSAAVLQHIGMNLLAYGGNRDFMRSVTR